MFLLKSGTVENYLFCSVLSDTLVENWDTCFQMYRKNASLCYLSMIIFVSGGIPARYITIETQERR